jgi:general nucleoside transport system permease protein
MSKPSSSQFRFGPFEVEPRPNPPSSWVFLVSSIAVIAAFFCTGIVFAAYGVNPLVAYSKIIQGTLLEPQGLSTTVQRAIPLLLIGVGLVLAFRAQFLNIGAEGQMVIGATIGGAVALFVPPLGPLTLPLMFIAGFLGGAACAFLPAILKLKLEINEVITTLMLNYVASGILSWLVNGPWKGKNAVGYSYTNDFPPEAWLPFLGDTRIHWPTLLLGLAFAGLVTFVLSSTRLGFRMRILGENPVAAKYIGINSLTTVLAVALFSGGLAGMAGVAEVASIHHKLLDPNQISLGYGFTAIIAAYLARGNPLAVIITSLLLGAIFASGDVMKVALQMPGQTTNVINGLMLFFLIGTEPLLKYKITLAGKTPLARGQQS